MKVLVIGSRGGIGSAVYHKLRDEGHEVLEHDPWGDGPTQPVTVFEWCDAVVACQGINEPSKPYYNKKVWDANVFGVIQMAKDFVGARDKDRYKRKVFVAVTSNSADIPRSKSLDYCAGKAAVDMALRVMQRDHVLQGFEFYSVAAGHVDTPMFTRMSEMLGADVMKAGYERSPLKRLIQPNELAEIINFLVTNPAAVWLSGSTLRVDGGEH